MTSARSLRSADSGRVTGFAGCNRYFGSYTAGEWGSLTFGPIGVTRMACSDGMQLEQLLVELFRQTVRYDIAGERLILHDGTARVAEFARGAP